MNIDNAIDQAIRDNKVKGDLPIVAHRKNNRPWLITMTADDWFKLVYGIGEEEKEDVKPSEENEG